LTCRSVAGFQLSTEDVVEFQSCLVEGKTTAKVTADLEEAKRLGLTATPVFLIGEATSKDVMRVTLKVTGAQMFQVFESAVQRIRAIK
jgi:predicted DsbA family dithiol-disulfide isomerase